MFSPPCVIGSIDGACAAARLDGIFECENQKGGILSIRKSRIITPLCVSQLLPVESCHVRLLALASLEVLFEKTLSVGDYVLEYSIPPGASFEIFFPHHNRIIAEQPSICNFISF